MKGPLLQRTENLEHLKPHLARIARKRPLEKHILLTSVGRPRTLTLPDLQLLLACRQLSERVVSETAVVLAVATLPQVSKRQTWHVPLIPFPKQVAF